MTEALPRSFFDRPVLQVAADLLGCDLVSQLRGALVRLRLSEVEAYDGSGLDPGSHAFRGRTARNAVMFGEPGHLYVYFSYGMHWCANIVCREEGHASAVLLRAGRVVAGEEAARERRPTARAARDLARGPARLTGALGITGDCNGLDLCAPDSPLIVTAQAAPPVDVRWGPRVGVSGEGGVREWRCWVDGDPTVSPYRPAVARRRAAPRNGRAAGGSGVRQ
ncbi:MAG: DNA-3-methyladenine glycosylase [Actinomycetales bacterium]